MWEATLNTLYTQRLSIRPIGILLLLLGGLVAFPNLSYAMPAYATVNQFGAKSAWPSDLDWRPINGLNDPVDSAVPREIDFVGDSSNPGAYIFSDDIYWYLRARVDVGTVDSSTFHDSIFIMIDRDNCGSPEYSFSWDSKGTPLPDHGLELQVPQIPLGPSWADSQFNDIDTNAAKKTAPPDFAIPTDGTTGDGYVRTIDGQSTTNLGNTTFVDVAVSWAFLTAQTSLRKTDSWNIQLGSIANSTDHNAIRGDVAGNHSPTDTGLSFVTLLRPTAVALTSLAASSVTWGDIDSLAPSIREFFSSLSSGSYLNVFGFLRGLGTDRGGNAIAVSWKTATETDTAGFNLYRSTRPDANYTRINKHLIPASNDPLIGGNYSFQDVGLVPAQTYYYLLEEVELSGVCARYGPVSVTVAGGLAMATEKAHE